jgi:hypothetical protein
MKIQGLQNAPKAVPNHTGLCTIETAIPGCTFCILAIIGLQFFLATLQRPVPGGFLGEGPKKIGGRKNEKEAPSQKS